MPTHPPRHARLTGILPGCWFAALAIGINSCIQLPASQPLGGLTKQEWQMLESRQNSQAKPVLSIELAEQRHLLEAESRAVSPGAPGIDALIAELEATARQHHGEGIAAVQIGIPVRVILIQQGSRGQERWMPLINPSIVRASSKSIVSWENCLSVPWGYRLTFRPAEVTVQYDTRHDGVGRISLQGGEAVIFWQEIEHLNGILLNQGYSKEWFIPYQEMQPFAKAIWQVCQTLSQTECEKLMRRHWEDRAFALREIPQ